VLSLFGIQVHEGATLSRNLYIKQGAWVGGLGHLAPFKKIVRQRISTVALRNVQQVRNYVPLFIVARNEHSFLSNYVIGQCDPHNCNLENK